MKPPLVILFALQICVPVSVCAARQQQPDIAALEVHLDTTQEVLKDLKKTLEKTNDTLNGAMMTLLGIQNKLDTHSESIKKIESVLSTQDARVALLEAEKKKISSILSFLGYLVSGLLCILGFFKKSQIRAFMNGRNG